MGKAKKLGLGKPPKTTADEWTAEINETLKWYVRYNVNPGELRKAYRRELNSKYKTRETISKHMARFNAIVKQWEADINESFGESR